MIALALLVGSTEAAIFMRLDGVAGESADADHEGWIDVERVQYQVIPSGSEGVLFVGALTVTKALDKSSPKLAEAVAQGRVFPELDLEFDDTDGAGAIRGLFHVSLKNVSVLRYSVDGKADAPSVEFVILLFDWAEWTYIKTDWAGRPLASYKAYLDFVRNEGGSATEKLGFVVTATQLPGEGLRIQWVAEEGRTYRLMGTTDLGASFQSIQDIPAGNPGNRTLELPSTGPLGFYYLVEQPQ